MTSWQQAWDYQRTIPVIVRRREDRLRIRLPYDAGNRAWLRDGRRAQPVWDTQRRWWETPRAWFNDLVNRALERYGSVYIIQPYREQEKCAPACWDAAGHVCQCSCMGANHGMGNDGSWFEVSETFAFRWGEQSMACRLLLRRPKPT